MCAVFFVSACKHHTPISVTGISPHPGFGKPWGTRENVTLEHVNALPETAPSADYRAGVTAQQT